MTATRTTDLILPGGAIENAPEPQSVPSGALYPDPDSGVVYRNNDEGTAWVPWTTAQAPAVLLIENGATVPPETLPGTIIFERSAP